MTPDSTEMIARDIATDWGNEDWWSYLHPTVKATVKWLDERGYLVIVVREEGTAGGEQP